MNVPLCIRRVGVVSTLGVGFDAFGDSLRNGSTPESVPLSTVEFMGGKAPPRHAVWLSNFDAAEHLGATKLAALDRTTQFSIVACDQVIEPRTLTPHRTGVVLGSTAGSLKSISDFVRATYVAAKPYQVRPLQFPSTAMNCAAAQCAIWHGLRGVNSSVCAGELSGLAALSYAGRMLHRGHADKLIAGSVEELCDYGAWSYDAMTSQAALPIGEGAAVFELELAPARPDSSVQLLAVRLCRPGPVGSRSLRLGNEIRKMLTAVNLRADAVQWWSRHRVADDGSMAIQTDAVRHAGLPPDDLELVADGLAELIGLTSAASTSLQIAATIAVAPAGTGLLTAAAEDQLGCALIHVPAAVRLH